MGKITEGNSVKGIRYRERLSAIKTILADHPDWTYVQIADHMKKLNRANKKDSYLLCPTTVSNICANEGIREKKACRKIADRYTKKAIPITDTDNKLWSLAVNAIAGNNALGREPWLQSNIA